VVKRAKSDGGTLATTALTAARIPFTAHAYVHDPHARSYGREAAKALGVDPRRVFKTLLVDTEGSFAVGIVPVEGQLDLNALATALGVKRLRLAEPAQAERVTGYVVGGISPVGQKRRLPTVLDESARAYPTVFVSGGKRGLDIELTPDDLLAATGGRTAPIGK
jgi:Cys-tRNA(Pro)/Cys-tRNA(Cys) deacylase